MSYSLISSVYRHIIAVYERLIGRRDRAFGSRLRLRDTRQWHQQHHRGHCQPWCREGQDRGHCDVLVWHFPGSLSCKCMWLWSCVCDWVFVWWSVCAVAPRLGSVWFCGNVSLRAIGESLYNSSRHSRYRLPAQIFLWHHPHRYSGPLSLIYVSMNAHTVPKLLIKDYPYLVFERPQARTNKHTYVYLF